MTPLLTILLLSPILALSLPSSNSQSALIAQPEEIPPAHAQESPSTHAQDSTLGDEKPPFSCRKTIQGGGMVHIHCPGCDKYFTPAGRLLSEYGHRCGEYEAHDPKFRPPGMMVEEVEEVGEL